MSSRSRLQKKPPTKLFNTQHYIKHAPLLILAIVSFLWIINIITTKNPSEVSNYGIAQLYLPLMAPFFIFMTTLFGYLTLNIKRGFVIAFFTSLLLLFRLQQIQFETWWLVPFFIVLGVLIILTKKTVKKTKREYVQETRE